MIYQNGAHAKTTEKVCECDMMSRGKMSQDNCIRYGKLLKDGFAWERKKPSQLSNEAAFLGGDVLAC